MRTPALLVAAELWASASGAEEHAASITQLVFPVINFLIFVYLLKRFALPAVRGYLGSRRAEISSALREAGAAKESAEAALRDYRSRLTTLDEEAQKIHEELRGEGERENRRLAREAEELASRIKADADFLAAQEVSSARRKLRAELARAAREAAGELVERHLTPADRGRLAEEFLHEVEGSR